MTCRAWRGGVAQEGDISQLHQLGFDAVKFDNCGARVISVAIARVGVRARVSASTRVLTTMSL